MSVYLREPLAMVIGGLLVISIIVIVIAQMAGIGFFAGRDSSNLVSTSVELSGMLFIFAGIVAVGVLGKVLGR